MQLNFATRPSALARWQTNHVIQMLELAWHDLACQEVLITTRGDLVLDKPLPEIGGKGLFTHELEQALLEGRVQAAVHSLKDLPTDDAPGLAIGVILERGDARDALVCPAGKTLDELPKGAVIGTSSLRRQAQLLAYRSDLQVRPIRGNIDTRLRKVNQGEYEAIVLAAAGLSRLGLQAHITQFLPFEIMLPAPGQGALAVQCRAGDAQTLEYLGVLEHWPTSLAVRAERAFLAALGGGCSLPVGALASVTGTEIDLQVVVAAPDGQNLLRLQGRHSDPGVLGESLAQKALARGAGEILS